MFRRLFREEEGQDLIEYALLCFFIALVVILVLETLGPVIANVYQLVENALPPAGP